MSAAFVLISHNNWQAVSRYLSTIVSGYPGAETVVIDHASLDSTPQRIRTDFPNVSVICTAPNRPLSWLVELGCQRVHCSDPLVVHVCDLFGIRPLYRESKSWLPLSS